MPFRSLLYLPKREKNPNDPSKVNHLTLKGIFARWQQRCYSVAIFTPLQHHSFIRYERTLTVFI